LKRTARKRQNPANPDRGGKEVVIQSWRKRYSKRFADENGKRGVRVYYRGTREAGEEHKKVKEV